MNSESLKVAMEIIIEENKQLKSEKKWLKEQLEYLRSGEYINQLRFERDMLEDIAINGEVSKEDKEFIDCTHRNTELLEINKQLKEKIDKATKYINDRMILEQAFCLDKEQCSELLEILKRK